MKAELPLTVVLVLSGLFTLFVGLRFYFFPDVPQDHNALNMYDASVKGAVFCNIGALMLWTAWLVWHKNPAGLYIAWFIAIMINVVGLMVFFKSWNMRAIFLDVGRGAILILVLLFYTYRRKQ